VRCDGDVLATYRVRVVLRLPLRAAVQEDVAAVDAGIDVMYRHADVLELPVVEREYVRSRSPVIGTQPRVEVDHAAGKSPNERIADERGAQHDDHFGVEPDDPADHVLVVDGARGYLDEGAIGQEVSGGVDSRREGGDLLRVEVIEVAPDERRGRRIVASPG